MERAEARATFRLLDINHDGELSPDELHQGLADTGITHKQIEQLLVELDTDHDGKVTEEEFVVGFDRVYRALIPVVEWAADLPEGAFDEYESRGSVIPEGEHRAIRLHQLRSLGILAKQLLEIRELVDDYSKSTVSWPTMNMYHINAEIVKPLTRKDRCSWVELVAKESPQFVTWFMSHAWATAYCQTLEMIEWHAAVHKLPGDGGYWFCTLANNQHDLSQLAGALEDTPFWKAIAHPSCKGVVQLMDLRCTPPKRIWCVLEVYIVVEVEKKDFEVLTMIPEHAQKYGGKAVPPGPALRDANGKEHIKPEGGWFPSQVVLPLVTVQVQEADATREEDKTSILNHIVGSDDPQAEPPKQHPKYDRLNRAVGVPFHGAAMYKYAMNGKSEELRELLRVATAAAIDYQSAIGGTPAYIAAQEGHTECLELLIAAKADLNLANNDGVTPVGIAVSDNQVDAVQLLVALGAAVNPPPDAWGDTPLSEAKSKGNSEIVEILLAAGAK